MTGLRSQIALFYIVLSLPALLLVEHVAIAFKFERCLAQLDDGRVQQSLDRYAIRLAQAIAAGARQEEINLHLQRMVLQLERPRESLGTTAAYVLLELAEHPFHAELRAASGRRVAEAGAALADARDQVRRHWSAPLPGVASGEVLHLDLSVPSPWLRLGRPSFEWPIAVWYLGAFLLGSAWFLRRRVLKRIEHIGDAARAWSRGEFGLHLDDRSGDELGRLARELDRMAVELEALVAARARLATLEERRRLARELHDTVKQKVFALSLQIDAAREGGAGDPRAPQRLQEARLLVEEIQRELADQLRELSEADGAHDDLAPALQQRLDDFARRSGCALEAKLPGRLTLAPTQADALLRILDEALSNVMRHARATRVEVSLTVRGERASLQVTDDGCGGAVERREGMGLRNMRHRSRSLVNGELTLVSPDGAGTCLQLDFSLDRNDA